MASSRRLREALAVPALFTTLTLAMTWPVVGHLGEALPGDLGDPLLNAWILGWDADRMLDGFRGLWQAPIFHPYPNTLAYSEHLLGIAVLVAPVQWVFGNLALTYNVAFLLSYVLAGSGMYLLVRSLTGRRWAGVLAGMAFAFCPYRGTQMSHLQVLMSGWMPIGLWGLHLYHRTGSRRGLVAFVVAFLLQGLSNGYYLYFYSVPVVVVGAYIVLAPRHGRRRIVAELTLAAVAILAVLAPVISVYDEVRQAQGFVRDSGVIVHYSADLASYLQVAGSSPAWGRWLPAGVEEEQLFAGLMVMTWALAGLATAAVKAWKRSGGARGSVSPTFEVTWLYAGILLLAVLLSLGPEPKAWGVSILPVGPYRWALDLVPGLDGLRVTARLATIAYLALSVVAGFGVARVFASRSRRAQAWLGLGTAALIMVEGWPGPVGVAPLRRAHSFDTAMYAWLSEQPPGAVLELPLEGEDQTLHTLQFQYRTLEHGHPIVNGFSGYTPLLPAFLPAAPLSDRTLTGDVLRGLRQIGVRYVLVHEDAFADAALARATLTALRAEESQIARVNVAGTTTAFELRDVTWPYAVPSSRDGGVGLPGTPVSPAELVATASHGSELLARAFDGDTATRWVNGQAQDGTEWVAFSFARPRSIVRVRLEIMPRSFSDYPRLLRVESSRDGRTFDQTLFEGSIVPLLVTALPSGKDSAAVDLELPPGRWRALRLSQVGTTRRLFWALDEVTLWASD